VQLKQLRPKNGGLTQGDMKFLQNIFKWIEQSRQSDSRRPLLRNTEKASSNLYRHSFISRSETTRDHLIRQKKKGLLLKHFILGNLHAVQ
jgi:hypothetical protein